MKALYSTCARGAAANSLLLRTHISQAPLSKCYVAFRYRFIPSFLLHGRIRTA